MSRSAFGQNMTGNEDWVYEKYADLAGIFSTLQSNLDRLIWAPLSLMHQLNLEVDIYKINIGECISSMYHGREILGVWKKYSFIAHF